VKGARRSYPAKKTCFSSSLNWARAFVGPRKEGGRKEGGWSCYSSGWLVLCSPLTDNPISVLISFYRETRLEWERERVPLSTGPSSSSLSFFFGSSGQSRSDAHELLLTWNYCYLASPFTTPCSRSEVEEPVSRSSEMVRSEPVIILSSAHHRS
jgi:hypothetical protein